MGLPSGEVVARPLVARGCGCLKEFQHYTVDKFRAQRLAKFQSTRCEDCVAKLVEEHRKAVAPVPKGEALKRLPAGARLTLTLRPDGVWAGALEAGGTAVEGAGVAGAGPQAVAIALARQWIVATGGADD